MLWVRREDRAIARNYIRDRKRHSGVGGGLGEGQEANKNQMAQLVKTAVLGLCHVECHRFKLRPTRYFYQCTITV